MHPVYLIRYGLARSVARFAFNPDETDGSLAAGGPFARGATVVVRTHRGTELGEVIGAAPAAFQADAPQATRVAPLLRVASAADLDHARVVSRRRAADFEACQAVFGEGVWPLELIDAEPLLDEARTVLHYLGPHRLDAAGLIAILRNRVGLEVVLEAVGLDLTDDEIDEATEPTSPETEDDHGCGSCGSKSGGCGSCGSAGGGCAIKALVGNRSRSRAETPFIPQA